MALMRTPPSTPFKRGRPSPSGVTPLQRRKSRRRTPLRSSTGSAFARTLTYTEDHEIQQLQQYAGRCQFVTAAAWTDAEMRALVEYMLFYSPSNRWPSTSKKLKLWSSAAKFIHQRTRNQQQRSGLSDLFLSLHTLQQSFAAGACRAKTLKVLMKRFSTPHDAEQHYFRDRTGISSFLVLVVVTCSRICVDHLQ